jgi:hypothetical protein
MGIYFLRCTHSNKHIGTHDAICDTFVAIARNVDFHMGQEKLHALLSIMFNSVCRRINIVFTKNDIRTLVDIVIANPMQVDLLPQSCTIQGFATFDVAQAKEKNYHD